MFLEMKDGIGRHHVHTLALMSRAQTLGVQPSIETFGPTILVKICLNKHPNGDACLTELSQLAGVEKVIEHLGY